MNNVSQIAIAPELLADSIAHALDRVVAQSATPDALRSALVSQAVAGEYEMGEVIFRENASADELLLIVSGSVALEMSVPGRGKVRLISLGPGDWVGWSALMGGGRMTTSALALTKTRVAKFSADGLRMMCDQNPGIGYPLMKCVAKSLANRLVATRLQLLDLFSTPSTQPRGDERSS
jgi:CRP/FNR family transcriptional regulator, cyclic AMP receptor protein